jgi:hypothetical protein
MPGKVPQCWQKVFDGKNTQIKHTPLKGQKEVANMTAGQRKRTLQLVTRPLRRNKNIQAFSSSIGQNNDVQFVQN